MTGDSMSAKYTDARIRRKKLPGGRWPCRKRQVLSEYELAVLLALEEIADLTSDRIFAGTMLTAIVDRPPAGLPKQVANEWWSTVVPFAVADAGTGAPRLLVLEANTSPRLLLALEEAKASYRLISTEAAVQEAHSIMNQARSCVPLTSARRVSEQQHLLARHVRRALYLLPSRLQTSVSTEPSSEEKEAIDFLSRDLREDTYVLLEEVALQRLIQIDDGPWAAVSNFIRHSSVDLVVVASDPAAIPLLAIEFDGQVHDEVGRVSRDQVKGCLLQDAGLPLLRVSHRDVRFKRWNKATTSSEDRRAMSQYMDPVGHLIRSLVVEAVRSIKYAEESSRRANQATKAREKASQRLFQTDFLNLNKAEREAVTNCSDVVDCIEYLAIDQAADQWDAAQQLSLDQDIGLRLAQRGVDIQTVTDLSVWRDKQNEWCASAVIVVNGQSFPYQCCSVTLNLRGADDDRIRQIIEQFFIEEIADEVLQISNSTSDGNGRKSES